MGWTFPWASSFGSDFNADFNVWFTEEQQREGGIEYNYRREAAAPSAEREAALREPSGEGVAQVAAMAGPELQAAVGRVPGGFLEPEAVRRYLFECLHLRA